MAVATPRSARPRATRGCGRCNAAMQAAPRDPANPQFTDHYFTGDYPTRLLDREIAEGRNDGADRQLSFLVDA